LYSRYLAKSLSIKELPVLSLGQILSSSYVVAGYDTLVITGVVTNNSVEATVRVAGNLGFKTYVVSDATATFDRVALDGKLHHAEDVHAHSLANMQGEYATVIDTKKLLEWTTVGSMRMR
jgi:nicotinamidase-related amidase